jgi:hypothetical protein
MHVHTAGSGRGYTLHVHTAGGERADTLHIHGCGKGYTPLHVRTAGGGKEYTLHVHTGGVDGSERDIQCTSKLQVVESDTPIMSIGIC